MPDSFHKGFETLQQETRIERLPVQGSLPEWLGGTLVRNGPARFEVGERKFRHWFDGLAMLHAFSFSGGQVSYGNRYLESRGRKSAEETGRIRFSEFATDPCRSIFQRIATLFSPPKFSQNANVSLTRVADRFVAITETPMPVEFDLETLRTVGVAGYRDSVPGDITTAHPHFDFRRKEAINYTLQFARRSSYRIFRLPAGSESRTVLATLPVREPAYMHSFAVTRNYVVLAEFPLVVSPLRLLLCDRPFIENYRWKPELGTRFHIVSKDDGRVAATCDGEAFFAFHHINAFERDSEIVLDVCAYEDKSIMDALYLDRLRGENGGALPLAQFRRYRAPLNGGDAGYELVTDEVAELPRIHYRRCCGEDYRYAYGISARKQNLEDFTNQLVKVDVRRGEAATWFEEGCYPGEPVFVASPGADAEDDGVILSVVLDGERGSSFLLVLEASGFREVARAEVPHHIPFGFHGMYF